MFMPFHSPQSKFNFQSQSVSVSILIENLSMTKKEEVSKRKTKSLNAKFRGLKQNMGQIKEDQRCIRDEQRKIRGRLEDVRRQCDEVRLENSACVMFQIIKAREDGDFDKAALLCRFLNSMSDRTNHLFGSGKKKKVS
ncbi:hypothetical protein ES288_D13G156200v1 [Gossypium darwinii]|uniref:Uncharacterized protein n=2 Tax=Gossypium TaxID=3633 RepID=A0A5D2HXN4_GOSTO|nr:hypothetical protein ES288_D13G156200v1 [Gossypium darwinii]TYH34888.1 hypothetical protein ES332_D13G156200v1 [Gossypium tomentosum]